MSVATASQLKKCILGQNNRPHDVFFQCNKAALVLSFDGRNTPDK